MPLIDRTLREDLLGVSHICLKGSEDNGTVRSTFFVPLDKIMYR